MEHFSTGQYLIDLITYEDEYSMNLFKQGKITKSQFEWIKKCEKRAEETGCMTLANVIVQEANEFYKLVKGINNKCILDRIAGELVTFLNYGLYGDQLPKLEKDYHHISRKIGPFLGDRDYTTDPLWTLKMLIGRIAEEKHVQFTQKPTLRNSEVLVINQKLK